MAADWVVLVAGGHEFKDVGQIYRALEKVLGWSPTGKIQVVTGGAIGADLRAKMWARERGMAVREFPIADTKVQALELGALFDRETHGDAATAYRNQHMLDEAKPDQGVVFAGGNGTVDMLTRLFARGVDTWVVGRGV